MRESQFPEDYAEYYDGDHVFQEDIPFYLDYSRRWGPPILELACGTGRVLVPLAESGYEVHGFDISENMLAICRKKIEARGLQERVHLSLADLRSFNLDRKDFSLAFLALRSFMLMLSPADQLACLERVYRHLRPGGCLILTLIAPNLEKLSSLPGGPFILRREFDLPNGRHVLRYERLVEHDRVYQVRRFEFKFVELDQDGEMVKERLVPLTTRYTFRFELTLLLEKAGFELDELFGDYDRHPYDGKGELIAVTHRPG